ncbi:MAG: histidine ammonia-lyase [Planctomycetota bacterium]|nr:histidine ammonia-lyase [Planctomycetota bacterium]
MKRVSSLVSVDGRTLTWRQVVEAARYGVPARLAPAARSRMEASRKTVDEYLRAGDVVYGVTTGFGKFANVHIEPAHRRELQINLIRSHAAGVGEPFDEETVRAMLLLRAQALAVGASGVRPALAETLLEMLNKGVHPVVPQIGSLGASGDLAPLAHLALVAIGEGEAVYRGRRMPGRRALKAARIAPLRLEAKEGLALLNGTQAMCAVASLAVEDAWACAKLADIAGAMSIDATLSSRTPSDPAIHDLRPYPGAKASAKNIRTLLRGSKIVHSHAHCARVQDPYSLRCMPQVHGAARDAVHHVEDMLAIELNAATDNPLVLGDGRVLSGGNFHGQPIAIRMDYLALALHELGSISERRVDWIMNPNLTDLHAFLAPEEGLNSGYMIAQYTSAALVSENKTLCGPSSADSIPVSGNQEDHVSMGMTAARRARMVLENLRTILSIELLCAAQAVDLRKLPTGAGLRPVLETLRRKVPPLRRDRVVSADIAAVREMIVDGSLLRAAELAVGRLS